jgi:curli biogenesis system outer membrane secretion channel CsgG
VTQGGSSILTDVLVKAGGGAWFDVAERADLQSLLQERQIIQNTRTALMGKNAQSLPPLRFAGVLLDGGVIGLRYQRDHRAVSARTISASAATSRIARISYPWRCGPSVCRPDACWRR